MELIRATPLHLDILVALERDCFRQAWSSATLADALGDERYIVLLARLGENFCGFALGWNIGEEAELARIGVLAHWRNRQLGEELTRALCTAFKQRDAEAVFLEVREDNIPARRLYEKCGFLEIGLRKNYYEDGQNAIIMRFECL